MDTRAFYDRISGAYDLIADASEAACREQGLTALGPRAGERVLEIGFGTGHALASLAGAVGTTGRVYGVDLSQGMLRVAQDRTRHAGGGSIALAIDDARHLCFRSGVFDAVFMSFTLELFDAADIPVVLGEVRRVLRPGGRAGVVGMAHPSQMNAMTEVYEWMHRHFPHFVDCRPIDVVGALRQSGLEITHDTGASIWGLAVACAVGKTRPGQALDGSHSARAWQVT